MLSVEEFKKLYEDNEPKRKALQDKIRATAEQCALEEKQRIVAEIERLKILEQIASMCYTFRISVSSKGVEIYAESDPHEPIKINISIVTDTQNRTRSFLYYFINSLANEIRKEFESIGCSISYNFHQGRGTIYDVRYLYNDIQKTQPMGVLKMSMPVEQ